MAIRWVKDGGGGAQWQMDGVEGWVVVIFVLWCFGSGIFTLVYLIGAAVGR